MITVGSCVHHTGWRRRRQEEVTAFLCSGSTLQAALPSLTGATKWQVWKFPGATRRKASFQPVLGGAQAWWALHSTKDDCNCALLYSGLFVAWRIDWSIQSSLVWFCGCVLFFIDYYFLICCNVLYNWHHDYCTLFCSLFWHFTWCVFFLNVVHCCEHSVYSKGKVGYIWSFNPNNSNNKTTLLNGYIAAATDVLLWAETLIAQLYDLFALLAHVWDLSWGANVPRGDFCLVISIAEIHACRICYF